MPVSQRITRKTVESAFATFVGAATRAGFDTETWFLKPGQGSEPCWEHYSHKYPDGEISSGCCQTPFRSFLGITAREAYDTLSTRIDVLGAINDLHRQQSDS